jgi:hypothetical protein
VFCPEIVNAHDAQNAVKNRLHHQSAKRTDYMRDGLRIPKLGALMHVLNFIHRQDVFPAGLQDK